MPSRPPSALVLCLALGLATTGFAQPKASPKSLADFVPQDTLVYVHCAGLDAASAAATDLNVHALWREPQMQAFLAPLVEAFRAGAAGETTEAGQQYRAMRPLLGGRLSIAVRGTTLIWERSGMPLPVPSGLISLELPNATPERKAAVEKLLARAFGRVRSEPREVAGHLIARHEARISGTKVVIERTWSDGLLLVGINRFFLEECLEAHAAGTNDRLQHLAAFQRCRRKSAPDPLLEVFVNVPVLADPLSPFVPDEARHVMKRLDLEGVDGLYMSSAIKDGDGSDTWFVSKPAPHEGLFALCGQGPLSAASRTFAPDHSVAYLAGKLDLAALHDLLLDTTLEVLPPTLSAGVQQVVGVASSALGVDVREHVLGSLGDEYALYLGFDPAGLRPDVGLMMGLRDAAKARELLLGALAKSDIQVHERKVRGRTTWLLTPGHSHFLPMGVPASPSLAITDSHLILTATTRGLEGVFDRLDGKGAHLGQAGNFRAAFRGYDVEKAVAVSYIDLRRAVDIGYGWVYDFIPGVLGASGLPLDPALVPSPEVVTRHFTSAANLALLEPEGLVLRGRNFGLAPLLSVGVHFLDHAKGDPFAGIEALIRQAEGHHAHPARPDRVSEAPLHR